MLHKVIIRSNRTDVQCEEMINAAIAEYPNHEILFDMLIEDTAAFAYGIQHTMYTLMIRVEEKEDD